MDRKSKNGKQPALHTIYLLRTPWSHRKALLNTHFEIISLVLPLIGPRPWNIQFSSLDSSPEAVCPSPLVVTNWSGPPSVTAAPYSTRLATLTLQQPSTRPSREQSGTRGAGSCQNGVTTPVCFLSLSPPPIRCPFIKGIHRFCLAVITAIVLHRSLPVAVPCRCRSCRRTTAPIDSSRARGKALSP